METRKNKRLPPCAAQGSTLDYRERFNSIGEKPSRAFKTQLWKLFAAQLDGEIKKKEEAYSRLRTFV